MKKLPLISVIIPNRSFERNESLQSIKAQSYKNIEIIEEIDTEERGAGYTRNRGAEKAKGEYLFFCDNDLVLEKDCLENLFNTLQENKWAGWAFGRFKIGTAEFNFRKDITPPHDQESREFIEYFHGVSTMSLIRSECKPVFDESLRRYEDWELWIRLTKAHFLPAFCDKILFSTVNRPHGISMGKDQDKWIRKIYEKHLTKYADIIITHHDQHQLLAKCLELIDTKIFNIRVVCGGSFAQNCNTGANLSNTDTLIFLNDDTLPVQSVLERLAKEKSDITGVAQFIPSRRKTYYGLGYKNDDWFLAESIVDVVVPSGFCFKVKKKVFDEMKGLDEGYKNGAEDVDFFLQAIKENRSIGYIRQDISHLLSKSEGRFDWAFDNNLLFKNKWDKFLKSTIMAKAVKAVKNRMIKTDENQEGEKCEIIAECKFQGERLAVGAKIVLNREQQERMRLAGCIM